VGSLGKHKNYPDKWRLYSWAITIDKFVKKIAEMYQRSCLTISWPYRWLPCVRWASGRAGRHGRTPPLGFCFMPCIFFLIATIVLNAASAILPQLLHQGNEHQPQCRPTVTTRSNSNEGGDNRHGIRTWMWFMGRGTGGHCVPYPPDAAETFLNRYRAKRRVR